MGIKLQRKLSQNKLNVTVAVFLRGQNFWLEGYKSSPQKKIKQYIVRSNQSRKILVPATACVVQHMTEQNHKYFRKKEKKKPSRGINIDVNICSFSVLLSVLWRTTFCPMHCCSKFNFLVGNTRKALFWKWIAVCSHQSSLYLSIICWI